MAALHHPGWYRPRPVKYCPGTQAIAAGHVTHAAFRRPVHRPVFRPDYHGGIPAPHGAGTDPAQGPPTAAARRPVSGGGAISPEIGGGLGDIGPIGSGGFDRVDPAPGDTGHWGAGGPASGESGGDPGGRRKDFARCPDSAGRVLPVFIVVPAPYLAGSLNDFIAGRLRLRIPGIPWLSAAFITTPPPIVCMQ